MKETSVFIVTKPLQYFNATNISVIGEKICIIINRFNSAHIIFNSIKKHSLYWDQVIFFEKWQTAYSWVLGNKSKINNLFIDTDNGFTKFIFLEKIYRSVNIFIYEEGIGNYRKSLGQKGLIGKLKIFIYNLMGNKDFLGGSKYIEGIYLYNIQEHKKTHPDCDKNLTAFNEPFLNHLANFKDSDIFLNEKAKKIVKEVSGLDVVLYLSSWSIHPQIEEILAGYPNYVKIFKPHPHIDHQITSLNSFFNYKLEGYILVELFIQRLLEVAKKVIILHHGTSSLMYFNNSKDLIEINLKNISQ